MRLHLKGNRLWRWWWPLGLVVLLIMTDIGIVTRWSAGWWAAAAVVTAVYLGAPVMAGTLRDLTKAPEKPPEGTVDGYRDPQQPVPAMEPTLGGPEQLSKGDVMPTGELPRQSTGVPAVRSPWKAGPVGSRPWRKAGSAQFTELVYALSEALGTVDQADDTAVLAGVKRHFIRGGRDNALQRWLVVLELAIDDGVDDRLVNEALNQSKAERLRGAAMAWFGSSLD